MRWLVRGVALALLVAVAVFTGLAFFMVRDDEVYRTQLTALAQELTGRELRINGDVRLRFGLIPTLAIDDVALASGGGGADPIMASFKRIKVDLEPWSLLDGRVRIKHLKVIGGRILLERDRRGVNNWQFRSMSGATGGPALTVDLIRLQDVEIIYRDSRSGRRDRVKLDWLSARPSGGDGAMELDVAALYEGRRISVSGVAGPLRNEPGRPMVIPVDLVAYWANVSTTVKGQIAIPVEGDGTAVSVSLEGASTRGLRAALGSGIPRGGPFRLSGKLRWETGRWNLSGARVKLGSFRAHGGVIFDTGPSPFIIADVTTSPLDLNGDGTASAGSERWVFDPIPVPYDRLPNFHGVVTLRTPSMKLEPFTLRDVYLVAALKPRVATVRRLRARVLGGTVRGRLAVDARRRRGRVGANLVFRDVNIGAFLSALGVSDSFSGRGDVTAKLWGGGANWREVVGGINGNLQLILGKGRIAGKYIDLLGADLLGSIAPWAETMEDSAVNCLVGAFDVKNGIARNQGLLFDTDRVTIAGKGSIDLRAERYDMDLMPRPKDPALISLAFPINVRGPLSKPELSPDEVNIAKTVVSAVAGGLINPLIVLVPLVSPGTFDGNPCVAAMRKGPKGRKAIGTLPEFDDRTFILRSIEDIGKEIGVGIGELFGE